MRRARNEQWGIRRVIAILAVAGACGEKGADHMEEALSFPERHVAGVGNEVLRARGADRRAGL